MRLSNSSTVVLFTSCCGGLNATSRQGSDVSAFLSDHIQTQRRGTTNLYRLLYRSVHVGWPCTTDCSYRFCRVRSNDSEVQAVVQHASGSWQQTTCTREIMPCHKQSIGRLGEQECLRQRNNHLAKVTTWADYVIHLK